MPERWPAPDELHIGLGCMRLSTDASHDEQRAVETIAAAAAAGVTVFDTARAYGDNEALLARALRQCGGEAKARIVSKGGMTRIDGRWVPDGRGKTILVDCEASLRALDGLPIDLYLIHAPDPRTQWATSVRALARLLDQGLVRHVGVSNVNRRQLEEALGLAEITAVQVALNPFDDRAIRGGVLQLCEEKGISLIAHSPLGGPRRAQRLPRIPGLAETAEAKAATPAEIALAWLLDLSPLVVPIPGARRPETARSVVRAATITLSGSDRAAIGRDRGGTQAAQRLSAVGSEVVVVMGIPGAGKSRVAESLAGRGYVRLNRDERGGSLRDLSGELDAQLSAGVQRVVLDNTYLTRASRSHVIEAAKRYGASVRCMWLDTPLAQAQINIVERLLERFGALPSPDELLRLSRREPGLHSPTSQMRTVRELEHPSADEGFAEVERQSFTREPRSDRTRTGVLVAADVLTNPGWERILAGADPVAPHLVFHWCPEDCEDEVERVAAQLAKAVSGKVESAICPHGGGPPVCWCRPPLPGLPMAFARKHDIELSMSTFVGTTSTHQRMAGIFGARYLNGGRD